MPSTIYLVRHAESLHNTTKNFSLRDPPLTPLGTCFALPSNPPFFSEDVATAPEAPAPAAEQTKLFNMFLNPPLTHL